MSSWTRSNGQFKMSPPVDKLVDKLVDRYQNKLASHPLFPSWLTLILWGLQSAVARIRVGRA